MSSKSSLPREDDPCFRQRITYENCLRLRFFDSKCFLDHLEYKDCILYQQTKEVKKIESPVVQPVRTQTGKHAD